MKVPRVAFVSLLAGAGLALPSSAHAAFPYDPLGYSRLTSPSDGYYDWYPAWSRDGQRIAFVRGTSSAGAIYNDLYSVKVDGSALARLTTNENVSSPSWSPDGRRIVFSDALTSEPLSDAHIFVADEDGSGRVDLTPSATGYSGDAAWSPDGTRIAYRDGAGIWTMQPDGSQKTRLSPSGSRPAWSPAGDQLSFIADDGAVRVMNATDGSAVRTVTTGALPSSPANWSRDASKLVYIRSGSTTLSDVWGINLDGTGRTQITKTDAISEYEAEFSPTEDALLIAANRDDNLSLYLGRTAPPAPPAAPPAPPAAPPAPPAVTPAPTGPSEPACTARVRADGRPVGVSINASETYTNKTGATLTVVAPDTASSVLVSNDGGFARPSALPTSSSERYAWTLPTSGPERLPKTVYVRFVGACIDASQTYTDDIVLDQTPPAVHGGRLLGAVRSGRASAAARARKYMIRVRASDRTSGVTRAQAASDQRKPLKATRYRSVLRVRASRAPKWVRAQDRAGNWSAWKRLAR